METAIGNLREEIHQDKDPYANISQSCQPTAIDILEPEATVIMKLWDAKGWPNRDRWPQAVQ
jgi:hypothetical protein